MGNLEVSGRPLRFNKVSLTTWRAEVNGYSYTIQRSGYVYLARFTENSKSPVVDIVTDEDGNYQRKTFCQIKNLCQWHYGQFFSRVTKPKQVKERVAMKDVKLVFGRRNEDNRRPSQKTDVGTFYVEFRPYGARPRIGCVLIDNSGELAWRGIDRLTKKEAVQDAQAHYNSLKSAAEGDKSQAPAEPASLPFPPLAEEEAKVANGSEGQIIETAETKEREPIGLNDGDEGPQSLLLDHGASNAQDTLDVRYADYIQQVVSTTTTMEVSYRVTRVVHLACVMLRRNGFERTADAFGNAIKLILSAVPDCSVRNKKNEILVAGYTHEMRPSVIYKPILLANKDGTFRASWGAYGADGRTPAEAMENFDKGWATLGPNQKL